MGGHDGDEAAHRVSDNGRPLDADVVEEGDEVVGVGRHRERSADAVGTPSAAQVGRQHREVVTEGLGEATERPVGRRDAVGGDDHRRPGTPAAGVQTAAVDVDVV